MKKKILALFMSLFVALSLSACSAGEIVDFATNNVTDGGSSTQNGTNSETAKKAADTNPAGMKTIAKDKLKIGVLYIGSASETSGYTYAHEIGIQGMANNIGLDESQIVRKENINDSDEKAVKEALQDCVDKNCNVIFATSWGYMEQTEKFAKKYPDIYFAHATGCLSNGKNFTNYFGRIYQARYLSGIVAGMNTKSNKIGYVAAMDSTNSEVTGGIDAFAMGIYSVNQNAKVYVKVTNSWFDPDGEKAAAETLLNMGCDVIAQHCDTEYPQTLAQEKGVYSIGYNSDMSKNAPEACLCSVIWNWSAYYTSAVQSVIDGTWDGSNYYGGMNENLVGLTSLADFCADGTAEKVEEAKAAILSGENGVFDGVIETNTGETVGKEGKTLDDATITGGIDWYFKTVEVVE